MIATKKVILMAIILVLFALNSCATHQYEGGMVGGGVGGVAGAMLDSKNPWRGGIIGAALGAIFGGTVADISTRASREAAYSGRPVEYRTENGRGVYRADPVDGSNERTKCKKVRERVWEDDRVIKDTVKEVCEGEKYERKY